MGYIIYSISHDVPLEISSVPSVSANEIYMLAIEDCKLY